MQQKQRAVSRRACKRARAHTHTHTHTHTKASQPAEKRAIVEGDDAHWAAVDPEQRLQLGPVG